MLYQLSYLAPDLRQRGANRSSGVSGGPFHCVEAGDERVDQIALQEHGVGSGFGHGLVQLGRRIAGERDQAEVRMVFPKPRHGGDAVHQRHVEVDHDGVRCERVGELDRGEAVACGSDDRQVGLVLDQRAERFEEAGVVVRE